MPQQAEWNFIFLIYADLRIPSNEADSDPVKFRLLQNLIRLLPIPAYCNIFLIKNKVTVHPFLRRVDRDDFYCDRYHHGRISEVFPSAQAGTMDEKEEIIGNYLRSINERYDSKKTILFTWDHGNVFGINKKTELEELTSDKLDINPLGDYYINPIVYRENHSITKNDSLIEALNEMDNPSKWLEDFRGVLWKSMDGDHANLRPVVDLLTNEMLARAIGLGGFNADKKLDIVCMMNCCMFNLHTAYALQENVQHLVAPVTWIYFPGYDYAGIFKALDADPRMEPGELCKLIVKTCRDDANSARPIVPKAMNEGIFAIELTSIEEVAARIKENILFEKSVTETDPERAGYLHALFHDPLIEFEEVESINYRLVDLYELFHFRTSYSDTFPEDQKKKSKEAYKAFHRNLLEKFIGKNVKKINGHDITGIAMSLPDKKTYKDPQQLFVKLFFKPGRYQSELVKFLELDNLVNTVYS